MNPVTLPSSSIPMTSLPPDAFAKAQMCLAVSLGFSRALFRSKYWFSSASAKRPGSLSSNGSCMRVS